MSLGWLPETIELRTHELGDQPTAAYAYVVSLSVVQLLTGFLTVGFVRPWGEALFGRRVPLVPVVVVAAAGGLLVTWLFDVSMLSAIASGSRPDRGLVSGGALAVMVACYAPILLWGPLELLATYGYWRRRRSSER